MANRWHAENRAESDVLPSRKSPNIARRYSSPRATESRLPQNTTAHFSGFNSRCDTLRASCDLRLASARAYVLRTCVLAFACVRARVLACNHVRPSCSVTSDVDDVAFPTSTSNMRAYARLAEWACTHCSAVMQSFEPRRVDHGRTWRRIARALLVVVNYYLRRYAARNGTERKMRR